MGAQIGSIHAESFEHDPKHLEFTLARYKFVAKMLHGKSTVLELGCSDATGSRIVGAAVGRLILTDKVVDPAWPEGIITFDMVDIPFRRKVNAIYALDVMEHIERKDEDAFLDNIVRSLHQNGVCIIGMPSLESQKYASGPPGWHVNCKTEDGLRETMLRYFNNVFMFGMNDETLHTGFGPMCHYRLAVCT